MRNHEVSTPFTHKLWQLDVQKSPIYNAYLLGKKNEHYEHLFVGMIESDIKIAHELVEKMLELNNIYPGVLGSANNSLKARNDNGLQTKARL